MSEFEKRRVRARQKWIEIYFETKSVSITSRRCGVPRSTIYRWLKRFKDHGDDGLISQSRRPKTSPSRKLSNDLEKEILAIRKKYRWGPVRIATHLKRERSIEISDTSVWRVLKKHNVKNVRKYRRETDYKRYSRPVPGDRVQIDVTKIRPGAYQFTAIDDCTRLKVLRLFSRKTAANSVRFLHEVIDSFGEIGFSLQRIQTDCGTEFFNEAFQEELMEHHIKFRPIPPGTPHLNGKVERGQKTDKEEFYKTIDLRDKSIDLDAKLASWERFYNYERPHSSLSGKTPHERFLETEDKVPIHPEIAQKWIYSHEKLKDRAWHLIKKNVSKEAVAMSHMS